MLDAMLENFRTTTLFELVEALSSALRIPSNFCVASPSISENFCDSVDCISCAVPDKDVCAPVNFDVTVDFILSHIPVAEELTEDQAPERLVPITCAVFDKLSFVLVNAPETVSFTFVQMDVAVPLIPDQAPESVGAILSFHADDAAPLIFSQAPPIREESPERELSKNPVTVPHALDIPLNKPAIRLSPISANTVDGEWIPKKSFTAFTTGSTIFFLIHEPHASLALP